MADGMAGRREGGLTLIPVIFISSSAILPFFLLSHEGARPAAVLAEEGGSVLALAAV